MPQRYFSDRPTKTGYYHIIDNDKCPGDKGRVAAVVHPDLIERFMDCLKDVPVSVQSEGMIWPEGETTEDAIKDTTTKLAPALRRLS